METNKYDYVNVSRTAKLNVLRMCSKSEFFNEPIVYEIKDGCIFLRHATIDDNRFKVSPTIDGSNWYHFGIMNHKEDIEPKKYYFEEDSDEDCVILYYE